MKYQLITLSVLFVFFNYTSSFSQETEHNSNSTDHELTDKEEHHEGHHKKHAISFVISHTHIKSGVKNDTGDNWIALPSFAINYNYSFNEKWAIGLHNDIIVEEFIVEDKRESGHTETFNKQKNEEVEIPGIERSRPLASAIMVTFKPFKHIAFLAGGGMEFSKEENFGLIRFGMEFPFHIPNNWEIFGVTAYDINIDAYNSFTFGIGIAKLF
jgi:hypothetical protein